MRIRAATDFGALVAERRAHLGMTQNDLAQRAGVTREWVARLESGAHAVTLHRLVRVLRELDLVIDVSADSRA